MPKAVLFRPVVHIDEGIEAQQAAVTVVLAYVVADFAGGESVVVGNHHVVPFQLVLALFEDAGSAAGEEQQA